jgi:hypothetical protein
MAASKRPQRRRGSIGSVKAALMAVIEYNLSVIDNAKIRHNIRQGASHCVIQACATFLKAEELLSISTRLSQLEAVSERNGHVKS